VENLSKAQALLSSHRIPGSAAAKLLLESPVLSEADRQRAASVRANLAEEMLRNGASLLFPSDMPDRYRNAPNAPPALYCSGDPSCLESPVLAIVGTRSATTYGKAVAQKFAEAIARADVTVISGGALGIDAAAHKGALDAGGKTVAVLLTGIEKVYPRVHFGLFERIKQSGCLLSQFAVGAPAARDYRPLMRNYTVAALSTAVLVVEAPERSGALSTASAANDLGRQVFVVPANIDNINFRGSHALIRDGATLVEHPDQVLEALQVSPQPQDREQIELSEPQRKILSALTSDPLACEFIVERTGLQTSEVLSELTMLELDGHIVKGSGGYALRP